MPGATISGRRLAISAGAAALLAPLNSTMIAVALPAIRDEFGVGVVAVSWLVTAYLVAVAISQPVGGRLGDALGSLTVLRIGLAGMAVFSVLAAFAPSFWLLISLRSLQGVAAALLIPSSTAYLRKSVSVRELPGTLGTNGALISAGAAVGPLVGGLVLAVSGWPLIFAINIPAVAVVWLLLRPLPRDAGRGFRSFAIDPLSLAALVSAFGGLALLGTALRSGLPAFDLAALALLAAGAAAYAWRFRVSTSVVVDLNLFRAFAYSRSAAMTALSNLVMYTTLVMLPVYLLDEKDVGAATVGVLLFALSAVNVVAAPAGGRLAIRAGTRVGLTVGAAVLLGSAMGVLGLVAVGATYALAVPLALLGAGLGLGMAAQQSSALAAWPLSMAGSAAGTLSFMRYVGSVAGASLLAAVLGASPAAHNYDLLLTILVVAAAANLGLAIIRGSAGVPEPEGQPAARPERIRESG